MARATVSNHTSQHGTLARYVVGYVASLVLTMSAYLLVMFYRSCNYDLLTYGIAVPVLAGLALVQVLVQLVCFLHVGQETRPRWKLGVFLFMIAIVIIVVLGSLWIMSNLNDHMMSPTDINQYMQDQESI